MKTYKSGGPRVHATTPRAEIIRAIEEYERRAPVLGNQLAADLLACAADLREELELRETETWRAKEERMPSIKGNLVCVLCGAPWRSTSNRCVTPTCKGMCTWGEKKGGPPSSWNVDAAGRWSPKPPPEGI